MHDAGVLGRDAGPSQANVAVRGAADDDGLLAEARDHRIGSIRRAGAMELVHVPA